MLVSLVLDHDGIESILKGREVAGLIHTKAEAIAGQVRQRTGATVVVDDYTTDRAASSVTIKDRRGKLWQARDGVLTRAAAAQGLEVRAR